MPTSIQRGAAAALLLAAPLAAQNPQPAVSPADLAARLTEVVDSLAAPDQFSGLVVVAKDGAPVIQLARGMADRAASRANDAETGFNLGSINKLFTRIAIQQLAAQGTLDLDSSLARYWPDYPNPAARQVTIRQLLEHRAGIGGDIFAAPAGGSRRTLRQLRDFLPLFVNAPLQFKPGTRQEYSNAGYIILGLLVERLSGEDYYDYVRRHIYEPAGMVRTAHYAVDSLPPNTALGYTRGDDAPGSGPAASSGPVRPNWELLPGRGSSAGGGYSTAPDLLRFLAALREGRIPQGGPAGLGIAGGAPGINAVVEGDLPGGYDLIVFANLDPPAATRIARLVRGWLGSED